MDLSEYHLNPPIDFFAKQDCTTRIYIEAISTMKEIILGKFRIELDQAKEKRLLWSENLHRERIESAMEYLPEIIRMSLEDEIELCKKYLLKCVQKDEKKLQMIFHRGNVKQMREKLIEYKQKLLRKSLDLIRKQVQDMIRKLNENIKKDKINEVLNQMKELYHY